MFKTYLQNVEIRKLCNDLRNSNRKGIHTRNMKSFKKFWKSKFARKSPKVRENSKKWKYKIKSWSLKWKNYFHFIHFSNHRKYPLKMNGRIVFFKWRINSIKIKFFLLFFCSFLPLLWKKINPFFLLTHTHQFNHPFHK
jgi:hypothetical protein